MASSLQSAMQTASLLNDLESGQLLSPKKEKKGEGQWWSHYGTVALLTICLGAGSVIVNFLSMLFYQNGAVFAMGIVAMLVAPVVVKRQIDMEDNDAMRKLQNMLRQNVNVMSQENTRLGRQVTEFEEKIQSLKHCEKELAEIAEENGRDVKVLVSLVKQNGEIIAALRKSIMASALQNITDVFLDSDRDESASLDEKEIRVLSYRLAHLDGVTVNKDLLEEKLKEDSSLAGVMAILQASTKKTVATKDKVFLFGDEHAE